MPTPTLQEQLKEIHTPEAVIAETVSVAESAPVVTDVSAGVLCAGNLVAAVSISQLVAVTDYDVEIWLWHVASGRWKKVFEQLAVGLATFDKQIHLSGYSRIDVVISSLTGTSLHKAVTLGF